MAKRFMYVCLGILALAVAFHLGARFGHAEYVDHSATGIVAVAGDILLLDSGDAYEIGTSQDPWRPRPEYKPPIPVSEVRYWGPNFVCSVSNEVWHREGDGIWYNYGSPPAGPTPVQPTTWGQIKAEFGE
jgi:hypothetical protein